MWSETLVGSTPESVGAPELTGLDQLALGQVNDQLAKSELSEWNLPSGERIQHSACSLFEPLS